MINAIAIIKKIYQLDNTDNLGYDEQVIDLAEKNINQQMPVLLFHYCRELGNAEQINTKQHHIARFPLNTLGEYLIIATEPDGEAIWGVHTDDLKLSNPPVMVSRNHDTYDVDEVHWVKEADLDGFLLAQAIFNGVNGGLKHFAQVFDFIGDTIPQNIIEKLTNEPISAVEIGELTQSHARFFQIDDYKVVVMISFGDEGLANAFYIGGQDTDKFNQVANQLMVAWDNLK